MEPLKNVFSAELVGNIGGHIAEHAPQFDRSGFERAVLEELEELELKPRAQWVADCLHQYLPPDWPERDRILRALLHPQASGSTLTPTDDDGLRGWAIMPLTMLVGQQHLAHFDEALALLKEMTKRFTSEFAVRYFLLEDQARALEIMQKWVSDADEHVRRLVSEGTRPRLPWAMQLPTLISDPAPVLPLLKSLRDDPSEYVRRSVANHLNDVAKDHPDLIADLVQDWLKDAGPERRKLLQHASRTLIKKGHPVVLEAFGHTAPAIRLENLEIKTPAVEFGGYLEFAATLASTSQTAQSILIDYDIHFMKADGKQKPKVFKWTKLTLPPGGAVTIGRRHPIRPITTRRYYSGNQGLSLRINGQEFGFEQFELIVKKDC